MILIDRCQKLAEELGIEFSADSLNQPFYVDPNSEFVQTMLSLAGQTESKTVAYATDGAAFYELEDKVIFGPGDIAKAHTHDEWITLEQLELGQSMYGKLIEHFCQS
ncbi:MAG: M20/M25/M40 family metallo-hydrolase [Planctomycetaceae bacterium]